jgi:hypothetical protein
LLFGQEPMNRLSVNNDEAVPTAPAKGPVPYGSPSIEKRRTESYLRYAAAPLALASIPAGISAGASLSFIKAIAKPIGMASRVMP